MPRRVTISFTAGLVQASVTPCRSTATASYPTWSGRPHLRRVERRVVHEQPACRARGPRARGRSSRPSPPASPASRPSPPTSRRAPPGRCRAGTRGEPLHERDDLRPEGLEAHVVGEVAELRHLALRELDLRPQLALDLVELPRLLLERAAPSRSAGRARSSGRRSPSRSTRLGAVVSGRHFTLSHSLVSARCRPTSRPGFSRRRRAASGNHGPTAISSTSRITPSLKQRRTASFEAWDEPMSSPRTIRRMRRVGSPVGRRRARQRGERREATRRSEESDRGCLGMARDDAAGAPRPGESRSPHVQEVEWQPRAALLARRASRTRGAPLMKSARTAAALIFALAAASLASGATTLALARRRAPRSTSPAPTCRRVVDGRLDDAAWKTPPLELPDWLTYNPVSGQKLAQKTEVRVGYDDAGALLRLPLHRPRAGQGAGDAQPARPALERRLGRPEPRRDRQRPADATTSS